MPKDTIAFVINRYAEKNFESGGEKVDFFIVKALSELGYKIDVYCNKTELDSSEYAENIFSLQNYHPDNVKYKFLMGENIYSSLDVSYIHENTRHFKDKYTRNAFTKIIQSIFLPSRVKLIKSILKNEAIAVKNIKFLLVPSNVVANDLKEFFDVSGEKIFILPPPIEKPDENFRKIEHETFTFGLSARGFANKGGWQVILASLRLKLSRKNFKVIIIYPFTTTLWIVKLLTNILCLGKNIEFWDYCSDMDKFYSQIDCLIMASKREAFGLVAVEAMARGIPVLINTRCGVRDFISDEENGFIYYYNRPMINLYNKMLYILNNPDKTENIAKRAINIEEKLNFEQFKNNFKKFMEKADSLFC